MTTDLNLFKMGARFLTPDESVLKNLGNLAPLIGEWRGVVPENESLISSGWNVISVPGGTNEGFVFEVIPYQETLKFSPVVIQAGNRGPSVNGAQVEQLIFGLMYEQDITSVCASDFCKQRGFSSGTRIHAETGLFLNIGDPNGGFTFARLATVPHGNSVLALGSSVSSNDPGTSFFPPSSAIPTNLDGSALDSLGYTDPILNPIQFPDVFQQASPNSFLQSTLKSIVSSGKISDMIILNMTTNTPNADGGILNIPFIASNVDAQSMSAVFWIENIEGGALKQVLQYTQTVNLVFPPTGGSTPIVWPHISINTLVKVDAKPADRIQ